MWASKSIDFCDNLSEKLIRKDPKNTPIQNIKNNSNINPFKKISSEFYTHVLNTWQEICLEEEVLACGINETSFNKNYLNLNDNSFGSRYKVAIKRLIELPDFSLISTLNLTNNRLHGNGMCEILRGVQKLKQLKQLVLDQNKLNRKGVNELIILLTGSSTHNNTTNTTMKIERNDDEADNIINNNNNNNDRVCCLERLSLNETELGDIAGKNIIEAITNSGSGGINHLSLQDLQLRKNKLAALSCKALCLYLQSRMVIFDTTTNNNDYHSSRPQPIPLTNLDLSWNDLQTTGAANILTAWKTYTFTIDTFALDQVDALDPIDSLHTVDIVSSITSPSSVTTITSDNDKDDNYDDADAIPIQCLSLGLDYCGIHDNPFLSSLKEMVEQQHQQHLKYYSKLKQYTHVHSIAREDENVMEEVEVDEDHKKTGVSVPILYKRRISLKGNLLTGYHLDELTQRILVNTARAHQQQQLPSLLSQEEHDHASEVAVAVALNNPTPTTTTTTASTSNSDVKIPELSRKEREEQVDVGYKQQRKQKWDNSKKAMTRSLSSSPVSGILTETDNNSNITDKDIHTRDDVVSNPDTERVLGTALEISNDDVGSLIHINANTNTDVVTNSTKSLSSHHLGPPLRLIYDTVRSSKHNPNPTVDADTTLLTMSLSLSSLDTSSMHGNTTSN